MSDHEYDALLEQLDDLSRDVPPPPEDFHAGWVAGLEADMEARKTPARRTVLIRALAAAAALVFVVGGTLMSHPLDVESTGNTVLKAGQRSVSTDEAPSHTLMVSMTDFDNGAVLTRGAGVEEAAALDEDARIIRMASLTLGAQRYDECLTSLRTLTEQTGGWTASSSEHAGDDGLRVCYLTLRIPASTLDAFLTGAEPLGRVLQRSETADDVTESYQDTQARLATQQALMARLQALMTDAASLSDLLALESQMADTQYQIDRLQASLNATDSRVEHATVDITLREEQSSADLADAGLTLPQRFSSAIRAGAAAFVRLLETAAVYLVAALPFLAVVAAVWLAARALRFLIRKHRR